MGGCCLIWSSFGSRHGKGPLDRAGAIFKRFIRQVQLDVDRPQL